MKKFVCAIYTFQNIGITMATLKEMKSVDRIPRQNLPKEEFINSQIKVLQDETVGIIDSGADVCCLGFVFKITIVIRSGKGPAAYLSTNAISTKFVQGITIVFDFFEKPVYVCICFGFSSTQERETLLAEEELICTGFSFDYDRTGAKPCMKSSGITLHLYWNGRVWGLRLRFPTPSDLQLPISAIRLNHDFGENFANCMLECSKSSSQSAPLVVRRVGKGWTTELLAEWKRCLGAVSGTIVRKTFANTTHLIFSVEVENSVYP